MSNGDENDHDWPVTRRATSLDNALAMQANIGKTADDKSAGNDTTSAELERTFSEASNKTSAHPHQSSFPDKPNLTIMTTPLKSSSPITQYIQRAQSDLDQMKTKDIASPKTLRGIASPDLVNYIRCTENEFDLLLKETLASPTTKSNPIITGNDSTEVSFETSLDGLRRDLSFVDKIDTDNEIDSICIDENSQTISKDNTKTFDQRNKVKNLFTRVHLRFLIQAFLSWLFIASTIMVILGGAYPASPLLTPPITRGVCHTNDIHDQCNAIFERFQTPTQRFRLGMASFSFGFATSIRTMISAPLQRLDDKLKNLQIEVQIIMHTMNLINNLAERIEKCSYDVWEDTAIRYQVYNVSTIQSTFHNPPELDLGIRVPCNIEGATHYVIKKHYYMEDQSGDDVCWLRDVITLELLMEFAKTNFDPEFNLGTYPLILRNMWSQESFSDNTERRLTPSGILSDPQLSNFILPNYFGDATKTGYNALVPDTDGISLSQFVMNIQTGTTPYAKIGTQRIVEEFPDLRKEIVPLTLAKELFSWNPWPDELKMKISQIVGPALTHIAGMIPPSTYYPIFIAGSAKPQSTEHSRTDLHTEPIGNIAVQLHGKRQWTLVPPEWSGLLRPTVSKHGRGYVYSSLNAITELPYRLKELPLVWSCVTNQGDALWVPPWMWHRVEYSKASGESNLSIGASVFHFYPKMYALNFPLFAFVIIPNLIWEALGLNVE